MSERMQGVIVSKSAALAVILSLAIMPWFQGGRDPIGWVVLWGVALLGSYVLWRSDTKVVTGRLGQAWLALVAWTALSMIWSVNRYQTFTTLLLYVLVGIIFTLAASLRDNRRAMAVFTVAYGLFASIAAAIGLLFYVVNSYNRATSTFYLPNPFAGFLLPLVIIGLWRFMERKNWYVGLLAAFNLAVFVLTDSRGAIIALILTLAVGFWLAPQLTKQWRRLLLILVGAAVLVVLASVARSHFTHQFTLQGERFKSLASSDSTSSSDRIYFIESAVAIWRDHPLLGSGAGTFQSLHPKYQYRVISAGNSVHNYYVQLLSELGVVGAALLVYVLVMLILGLLRGLKADPTKLPLALGLVAILLHSAVDVDANYMVIWALVAILAGLCYVPVASIRRKLISAPTIAIATSVLVALPIIWLFQNQIKAQNGSIAQQNGDYARAISYYEQSHLHPPYDPDWLNAQGINDYVLATGGVGKTANLNQALALSQTGAKLDPSDGQHDLLRGRVLVQEHKLAEAAAAYQSAITKDPYNHPDYYNDLASVYLRQNNVRAAEATIKTILALYPDSVVANRNNDSSVAPAVANSYATAAEILAIQGKLGDARVDLVRAFRLDPTNISAQLLLQQIGAK